MNIIWTYWHQGFNNSPEVVQQCVNQLEKINPEYKVHVLDGSNVAEFLDPILVNSTTWEQLSLAHRSDLIRTQLLIKYGGVWVDPTVFCLQPFDEWLPAAVQKAGVFFFYKPGRDRIISNWFIAAEKQNPMLVRMYEELSAYWNKNTFRNMGREDNRAEKLLKRIINRNLEWPMMWFNPIFTKILRLYPYMVYHYMVYKVVNKDERLNKLFTQMPKVSADGPHLLQRRGMLESLDPEIKNIIDKRSHPLFKLSWKTKQTEIPEGSNLDYLFKKEYV